MICKSCRQGKHDSCLGVCGYCLKVRQWSSFPIPEPRNDSDFLWFAGLFEGEGSFSIYKDRSDAAVHVAITSTDLDVLEKALTVARVGRIDPKLKERKGRKDCWMWRVTDKANVLMITYQLLPHMCRRRQAKANEVLNVILGREYCAKHNPSNSQCTCMHRNDAQYRGDSDGK